MAFAGALGEYALGEFDVANDVEVSAGVASLTIASFAASVSFSFVSASTAQLTVTGNQSTVVAAPLINVDVATDALSLAAYRASIFINRTPPGAKAYATIGGRIRAYATIGGRIRAYAKTAMRVR